MGRAAPVPRSHASSDGNPGCWVCSWCPSLAWLVVVAVIIAAGLAFLFHLLHFYLPLA